MHPYTHYTHARIHPCTHTHMHTPMHPFMHTPMQPPMHPPMHTPMPSVLLAEDDILHYTQLQTFDSAISEVVSFTLILTPHANPQS